ncbi:hypothetical protein [Streptomyces sp. NBC_01373]|uniref:hypothetical protein n=1 Tax=Streptomyces sp. NBC_01373 TaxID=2903843 RepID=UPI0022517973|nr:hypothetical protein [Streptomyces sp. NBC_01373]MCX4699533.1 hypothetical protein [Streptomyces sp. NBC_01373]
MSRRKQRKPRKQRRERAEQPGRVFLTFEDDDGVVGRVELPGFTELQCRKVQSCAQVGDIHNPLVMRFIRAFGGIIGYDFDSPDAAEWTDETTVGVLRWLNFVPDTEWTGLDDVEFARMTGGGA